MVNEFHNLNLTCVPPQVIPPYGNPANQGCTLPGATAGSTYVNGEAYLKAQLNYSYDHLWRNVAIVIAFWVFFVALTLIGLELRVSPQKGGGNVNVYKKGHVPKVDLKPGDEEAQKTGSQEVMRREGSEDADENGEEGLAKSKTVFTWSGVKYVINVKGGKKALLNDIHGYVKPGRLTALMGGTHLTAIVSDHIRIWSRKNNIIELSLQPRYSRCYNWSNSHRWSSSTYLIPTLHRLC